MSKNSSWHSFKLLWPFLRPQSVLLFLTVGVVVMQVAANVLVALYIGQVVDRGLVRDLAGFRSAFILLALAFLAIYFFLFCRMWLTRKTAEHVALNLRGAIVEHLAKAQLNEEQHSGEYLSRLNIDIGILKNLLRSEWAYLVGGMLSFLVSLMLMLNLSASVTLVTLTFSPLMLFLASRLAKPMGKHTEALQGAHARLNSLVQDTVAGILVVKAFNLQSNLGERLRTRGRQVVDESVGLAFAESKMTAATIAVSFTPFFVLFGVGGVQVMDGQLSFGQLVTMINLLSNLTFPLQEMSQSVAQIVSGLRASQKVVSLLDLPLEREGGAEATVEGIEAYALELTNVSFSYNENRPVLHNLSFKVKKGERVAIMGASGAGKSTLFSLLLGLRAPSSGVLRFFGQSISELNLSSLRRQIAYVPQEAFLLPLSVTENIGYGDTEKGRNEIKLAAVKASAEEFIHNLPQGYDTVLGERGSGLSGGQKQRLALSRALLRNAPLLLLDEATAALDADSEAKVQEALRGLDRNVTMVVVAHRLYTLQAVDRVIVLAEGQVVEDGSPSELGALGGHYSRLVQGRAEPGQLSPEPPAKEESVCA